MVDDLYKTLNWATEYNTKLKTTTWDAPTHTNHMKDMLNVINQIHDGTFDEDLVNISKRVNNIEKLSRQNKFPEPNYDDWMQINNGSRPNLNHPYLKKKISNYHDKADVKVITKKNRNHISKNKQAKQHCNLIVKNNFKRSKSIPLQHTPTTNTSIIPLNTDYVSRVNILPSHKATINNSNESLSNLNDTEFLIKISKNKQKHKKTPIPKTLSVSKEHFSNGKTSLLNRKTERKVNNTIINSSNENYSKNKRKNLVLKRKPELGEYDSRVHLNDTGGEQFQAKVSSLAYNNTGKKRNSNISQHIEEMLPLNYEKPSNNFKSGLHENLPTESVSKNTPYELYPVKFSQACQTVPCDDINTSKLEDRLDMRQFLNLYSISIDPEFMEEELERFSLRLHERINYYMENEGISLDIDNCLKNAYARKNVPTVLSDNNQSVIDLEQDSYNSIPNDIFNDVPSSTSEVLLQSIVNAFKNTSFHDIVKNELKIDNVAMKRDEVGEEIGASENYTNSSSVSYSDKNKVILSENSEPPKTQTALNSSVQYSNSPIQHSEDKSGENHGSITYSEDFLPVSSSSCSQRSNYGSISINHTSSHSREAELPTNVDSTPTLVDSSSLVSFKENRSSQEKESMNCRQSNISNSTVGNEIVDKVESLPILKAEDLSLSIQKESQNFSEGELIINLPNCLKPKSKILRFQDEVHMRKVDLATINLSELSIVGMESESLETGNIQMEQCLSEEDATISSGEIGHVNSPTLQFKNEEMFQLYRENEVLRQRLAFLRS